MEERKKAWSRTLDRYANRHLGKTLAGNITDDHVKVNMLFSNVKTKLPGLIFQNPDLVAIPGSSEQTRNQKLLTEAMMRYYIRELNIKKEAKRATLDGLLKGYGCLKLGYSIRTWQDTVPVDRSGAEADTPKAESKKGMLKRFFPNRPKQRPEELMKMETDVSTEPVKVASEGPMVFRVAPENILTHPDAKFPADKGCRWLIHQSTHSMLELQYDDRFPMSKREKLKPSQYIDQKHLAAAYGKEVDPTKIDDPDMQFVTLFEIWDRISRRKIVLADNNWELGALLADDWPYEGMEGFPFEFLLFHEILDEFKALSEEDPIINQLEELEAIRTYQMRHIRHVSNRVFIRTANFKEGVDERLKNAQDGEVLETDADDARAQIAVVPDAGISRDVYQADSIAKEDINNVSAVTEFDRGRVGGAQTATEAAIIEGANRQRSDDAKGVVDDWIMGTLTKMFQILQQWLPTDLAVKIAGPSLGSDWQNIEPEDIAGEWAFTMVPGSTAVPNREILRSQALRLLEMLAGAELVDQRELILMVLENFPELMAGGRTDRLVKDPKAAEEAAQQGQEGQGQGGAGDLAAMMQQLQGGGGGNAIGGPAPPSEALSGVA